MDVDELRYSSYDVVIQRAEDGETRTYHDTTSWGQGSWYWWSEGNQCCDCNRALSFIRGSGEQPTLDDRRVECSDGRYSVLRFIFPDGLTIPGPDADQHQEPKP